MMTAQPLRGRNEELDRARDVLRRTANTGQGSVVLISGEPGIGKTALVDAIVDEAKRTGFSIGVSKAEEHDQIAPMAPLLVALRSGPNPLLSATEFAELAPLYHQQLWLVDRLASMLEERSSQSPLLIAIDDVQWADQLSVFALRVAPGRLAGSPVIWLLATRDHPGKARNDIVVAAARDVSMESIALGPLSSAAIEQLAVDRHGASPDGRLRKLLEAAEGFPFLAVELLDGYSRDLEANGAGRLSDVFRSRAAGDRELPSKLIAGVGKRLDSLPPDTLQLVRAASVLGRAFSIEDAAAIAEAGPWTAIFPAVTTAVHAGVFDDQGDRIAFRHDLFRQAVYEGMPLSMRVVLHRAAAERLLAVGRGPVDAAPHLLASAEHSDRDAAGVLRQAAAAAAPASPSVAAELIERALRLLDSSDAAYTPTGEDAIAIFIAARRDQDAVKTADQLLALPLAAETAARIQIQVGRLRWKRGDVRNMRTRVDAARALNGVSRESRAELDALHVLALSHTDTTPATVDAAERALEQARAVGARHAEADALRALGNVARDEGFNAAAVGYFRELRGLDPLTPTSDEIISLQLLDRYNDSADLLAQLRAQNEEQPDNAKALALAYGQMWHNRTLGFISEADADARTLLRICEDLQDPSYLHEARLMLSLTADHRGDLTAARAYLTSAQDNPNGKDERWTLRLATVRSWIAESEGDVGAALASVRNVFHLSPGGRHRWRWAAHWLMAATRIAARGGDSQLAREVAEMARVLAERNPNVATLAGIAEHVDGLARRDIRALRNAVGTLRASPRPLVRADAIAELGSAELEAGRPDAAVASLDDAWDIFNRHGAAVKARRVQQLLQRAGVRRRPPAGAARPLEGWAALTQTEQRVARLIADGHSNRSAAAELVLSPNTVATHLRSIFGKLTVKSRSQLTRAVLSHRQEAGA